MVHPEQSGKQRYIKGRVRIGKVECRPVTPETNPRSSATRVADRAIQCLCCSLHLTS